MSEQQGDSEEFKERRKQGIHLRLPGGAELDIAGPFTIMALLLVLMGANCWLSWQGVTQLIKLGDAVVAQTRSINMVACMAQSDAEPARRKERFEECGRWFK